MPKGQKVSKSKGMDLPFKLNKHQQLKKSWNIKGKMYAGILEI